jgi:succinyl-CoA synthetase beta subunit
MARLYEYQGKEILRKSGIAVPMGKGASTPEEAAGIAKEIGGPVVVKAQIWATGRFGAGGIKFADTPERAAEAARSLIGSEIKGLKVDRVLVEEKLEMQREFYVGVIVSNSYKIKGPVLIFSSEGGSSIEEVARRNPERIGSLNVDYLRGISERDAVQLLSRVSFAGQGLADEIRDGLSKTVCTLYRAFREYDARTLEVNPLIVTKNRVIMAADCHIMIDDNSVFRHP